MRNLGVASKTLIVFLIGSLALVLAILPLTTSRAQPPTPVRVVQVTTNADEALARIHPDLREAAKTGGDEVLFVQIDAAEGTDLEPYVVQSITRPFAPLGEATTFARVKAGNLIKIAGLSGVVRVQQVRLEITHLPPPPVEPDVVNRPSLEERRRRLERLRATDIPWSEAPAPAGRGEKPTAWYDVQKGHATQPAWAKGYRGQGVKVAVLDGGPDLAHPDLLNTWAVVDDRDSPYFGWPMALDPFSMFIYVLDRNFGTNLGATGLGFYVDTSATPTVFRSFDDLKKGVARLNFAPFAHTALPGFKRSGATHEYVFNDTSQSGVYHVGNLPDRWLSEAFGEHVAVLVVDENEAGVYDTVYVDLDSDHDFTDEKPVTRDSPAAYRDMDGDGFTDLSGGIVYFIADGKTQIPATDWMWGSLAPPPANGSLVAFMGDFDPEIGFHGTSTSSNVVGQARINGKAPRFQNLPGDGRPQGAVIGSAPEAKLVPVGDIYFNFDTSVIDAYTLSLLGYDGIAGTDDDIQITSNSYGDSDIDNDGWEPRSRSVDRLVRHLNPTVSFLFSTGNGAPGYGTVAPPSPSVGIGVGASTQFGSTGWDSITRTDQIMWGDVIGFSNRGPGARGTTGVDVVAEGAFGSADIGVNGTLDGSIAWGTFGGTSRSSPVAAGNLALVYQAFRNRHDRWPTYEEARAALKAGATQTGFDPFAQGAGRVNADISTDIAGGRNGVMAFPSEWSVGDYRGTEYPGFANIIHPGDSDTQTFRFHNDSNYDIEVNLSAQVLRRVSGGGFTFTSKPVDQESPYNFNAPDYLIPIENVPEDADLMVVSLIYPFDQFDPDGDYDEDQFWRLYVYDWTDINGDGNLWEDLDGDGIVDHANKEVEEPANIDRLPELDWDQSEIDRYEYVRVTYDSNVANNLKVAIGNPAQRMHDGLFIGLQHRESSADIPTTDFQFQIDIYVFQDWDWVTFSNDTLTVPFQSEATVEATITVPPDATYGEYQGMIFAEYAGRAPFRVILPVVWRNVSFGGDKSPVTRQSRPGSGALSSGLELPPVRMAIPVVASVAATYDGTGAISFGGSAANDPNAAYNNGAVRGAFNWRWRPESGDWRFFFLDMLESPPESMKFISRNAWEDNSPPTDIDTLLFGPTSDRFTDPDHPDNARIDWSEPEYYGPYTLDKVGGSPNQYLGSGKWRFDTATGGAEEWVAGTSHAGLHLLALHNVLFSGQNMDVPFATTLGTLTVQPTALSFTATMTATQTVSQCASLSFNSSLDLPGLAAEGFGLSRPEELPDQVTRQDDPTDPTSASYKRDLAVEHASMLEVRIEDPGAGASDLDLYLLYDANGDGKFSFPDELLGSSTTAAAEETVSVRNPKDGTYQVWVLGWRVEGESTFTLVIDAIRGFDVTVEGVPGGSLPAGTPVDLEVCYQKELSPGDSFKGEVLLGPTAAPGVIIVPLDVSAQIP